MVELTVVFNDTTWNVYFKTFALCMNFLNYEVYPWAIEKGIPLTWAYCS